MALGDMLSTGSMPSGDTAFKVDSSGNTTAGGTFTATGAIASSAGISGTTGAFSGAVSGTTGTFSGAVAGTTGTFTGALAATSGTFTGALSVPTTQQRRGFTGIVATAQLNHPVTGTTTVFTVPAGCLLFVDYVIASTEVLWDGTAPTLIVGVAGGDTDGYLPSIDLTATGVFGEAANTRGALLFDTAEDAVIVNTLIAGEVIRATVAVTGTPTVGYTDIYVFGTLVTKPTAP